MPAEHKSIKRRIGGLPATQTGHGHNRRKRIVRGKSASDRPPPVNRLPLELMTTIFSMVVFYPSLSNIVSWAYTGNAMDIVHRCDWRSILLVCQRWRHIALTTPGLWRIFILNQRQRDIEHLARISPEATDPIAVHVDSTASEEHGVKEILSQIPRHRPVYLAVEGEDVFHQLCAATDKDDTRLRALSIANKGELPQMSPSLGDKFIALEALSLFGYSTYRPLSRDHLRQLHIANAVYGHAELDSLVAFTRAIPTLDVLEFQDTIIIPQIADITSKNRLQGANIRRITFKNTEGVAALLACIGIPVDVRLVLHDIVEGDILPEEIADRGPFATIAAAKAYVDEGRLRVVIEQNGATLEAEWRFKDDWKSTLTELLRNVRTLSLHTKEDVNVKGVYSCAKRVQNLFLNLAHQSALESALGGLAVEDLGRGMHTPPCCYLKEVAFAASYDWSEAVENLTNAMDRWEYEVGMVPRVRIMIGGGYVTGGGGELTKEWRAAVAKLEEMVEEVQVGHEEVLSPDFA